MSSRDSETSAWNRRGRRGEAERLAQAESARIDADTARREAELERLDAEAARKRADAMRVAAETEATRLAAERDEALAKAAELEEALAAVRSQAPVPAVEPAVAPEVEPVPASVVPEPPSEPEPEAARPAVPESIRFATRGHQPVLTVLLALASLGAAATAVYLAYRDELTSGPGLLAATATVVLAVSVGRMGRNATTVTIEKGIVHVSSGRSEERADLTSPSTLVELIGRPGKRGAKVMLVRKTGGPLSVDDSMVDLDAFVDAVRHWRPGL
jgi:hypothetical protein